MSLETSIIEISDRLATWAAFPKYQLERRVDIFLTPFLEAFFRDRLRGSVSLVAPEFPLLASYRSGATAKGMKGKDHLTVNVDFLLHVDRKAPAESAWVFVELKTDAGSLKKDQHVAYAAARDVGMRTLRSQLLGVKKASRKRKKYAALSRHIDSFEHDTDRIEIAYVAPGGRPPFLGPPKGENPTHFFSLKEFAGQSTIRVPPDHRELWKHVKRLLAHL